MGVKERVNEYISHKNMSISEFEKICGLSNGYVSSMRKGLGAEKLNNVLNAFPDLNRDWLLYDEGVMLKNDASIETIEPSDDHACPFTNSITEILNISKEIIEMNKKLVNQQSDLIATIKSLAEKR